MLNGALTVSLTGGVTVSAGANGSSTLTLSGTQDQIRAALPTVSYKANLNFNGSDTLTVLSTDTTDTPLTDTDTVAITVKPVADIVARALSTMVRTTTAHDPVQLPLTVSADYAVLLARTVDIETNVDITIDAANSITLVVISLASGLDLAFSPHDAQGLETARPVDLTDIQISASGLGIHFKMVGLVVDPENRHWT